MARVQHRRTTTAGLAPNPGEILPGELVLDITSGKAWFGDNSNNPQLLTSKTWVQESAPTETLDSVLWFKPSAKQLYLFENGVWNPIGVSTEGGTFNGKVTVKHLGSTVFETLDSGAKVTGDLEVTGEVDATAFLLAGIPIGVCPPGAILPWAGPAGVFSNPNSVPAGWLLADGAEYEVADYPGLYAAIGRRYTPAATGGLYFNVPDARGLFMRFANLGRTGDWADPDDGTRTPYPATAPVNADRIGTVQADGVGEHQHYIEHKVNGTQGSSTNWGVTDYVNDTQDKTSDPIDVAAETRPINIALVGIIKT